MQTTPHSQPWVQIYIEIQLTSHLQKHHQTGATVLILQIKGMWLREMTYLPRSWCRREEELRLTKRRSTAKTTPPDCLLSCLMNKKLGHPAKGWPWSRASKNTSHATVFRKNSQNREFTSTAQQKKYSSHTMLTQEKGKALHPELNRKFCDLSPRRWQHLNHLKWLH